MTAPGNVVGLDCKAYRNTGTYASPTWAEMTSVIDVNQNVEKSSAKLNKRGSVWTKNRSTLRDMSIDVTVLWDGGAADCTALMTAALGNTFVDCVFLDGSSTTTGASGFRCEFEVFTAKRTEPLEDGVKVTFTLKPSAQSTHDPANFTVS